MPALVDAIAQAIARMEGYYTTGTIAARNHNPGNLRGGARQVGVDSNGYGIYNSDSDGWADLVAQVERNIRRGLNLYEFFGGKSGVYPGYAPAADGNRPAQYAEFVAARAGVAPNVPLNQAGGSNATTTVATDPVPVVMPTESNASLPVLPETESSGPLVSIALAIAAGALLYFLWE